MLGKSSLNFLKNNQYYNVSTELDTVNGYVTDLSNNRVSTLETNLTDISNNRLFAVEATLSTLSISDISGLSDALQNVEVGDIAKTDVTGLSTALSNKQDTINIFDNFILNSLYVVPFTAKAQVSPSRNGEIQASYMTVTNTTNGSIDVGETIVSLTSAVNGKQEKIKTTSNLSLATLDATGMISCGDLTVAGQSIQTYVL